MTRIVAGIAGGPPDLFQASFHPGGSTTRQHIGVQSQRSRRPPRGHAQLMHIFDVLVGLLGGQGQVVLHGGKPKPQRAARDMAGPVIG